MHHMSHPLLSADQLDLLTRANTDDILESLGLLGVRRGRGLLRALCWPAARVFARQVATCDWLVGEHGLPVGARWILRQHIRTLAVAGVEHVPRQGPLLIVSNHPGVSDTAALFVALPRSDLRIVAAGRPFLRALPNVSRSLIYIDGEPRGRLGVMREVTSVLRSGQAVLTFPGGDIEPDPAVLPDAAAAALARWSESIGLLVRRVPEAQVVPVIVSGVLSPAAQRHPLTRLRRQRHDQEWLGAILQVLVPAYHAVTVRVAFGPPLNGADLVAEEVDARGITGAIVRAAARLIEQPPADWQIVLRGRG